MQDCVLADRCPDKHVHHRLYFRHPCPAKACKMLALNDKDHCRMFSHEVASAITEPSPGLQEAALVPATPQPVDLPIKKPVSGSGPPLPRAAGAQLAAAAAAQAAAPQHTMPDICYEGFVCENTTAEHRTRFRHPCPLGGACPELGDVGHVRLVFHVRVDCPMVGTCYRSDSSHLKWYRHPSDAVAASAATESPSPLSLPPLPSCQKRAGCPDVRATHLACAGANVLTSECGRCGMTRIITHTRIHAPCLEPARSWWMTTISAATSIRCCLRTATRATPTEYVVERAPGLLLSG
jgi:hypothetical protein